MCKGPKTAIPFTVAGVVRRAWLPLGFSLFTTGCGADAHALETWLLLVAAATALAVPTLAGRVVALIRSARLSDQRKADLETVQRAWNREIAGRKRVEDEILKLGPEIEILVRDRTAQLVDANRELASMAAMVEYSNDAIVGLNLNRRIISWNRAAERMYGYRALEAMGQPVAMLAPAGLADETRDLIERLKEGSDAGSAETVQLRKTGERIDVYLTVSLIRDAAGEIQRISHVARDITERKRAEKMFHLAVDAAPNAMVMVDDLGRIAMVNSQTEKLFGYLREELIGNNVEILAPNWLDLAPEPRAYAMSGRPDLHGRRKDGREFPVEVRLTPIHTDQGAWTLSAIVDITDRKRAEEEIRRLNQDLERRVIARTAELTAANAELESFSYSVSHDLRAPLRQIAGFSRILLEECGPELNPQCRRYLHSVQGGAQHMGNLIDNLLNLARVGRQVVSRKPAALDALIESALKELEPDCAGREIVWRIGGLWSAECDRGLVKQVFVNLLSNAVKYTRLRIPAEIEVGCREIGGERVVFIRDNGAGFDMQYADKLFGVFQRLHSSEEFEGTGVGLAIVQRIVHKHGGRIWAAAEPDRGATFFFTIPDRLDRAHTPDRAPDDQEGSNDVG
jgi:PAS domain S-box-containing protein